MTADMLRLVLMYPGLTTWTDTLDDANSDRSASQYPITANLLAAYDVLNGVPTNVTIKHQWYAHFETSKMQAK